jgi:small subunit ribosomal protein S6
VSDEQRTRRYETMIVLRTDLQEAGLKEQIERIRKLLETQGANVAAIHEWGLRELAYIIQKERRGFYVLAEYTASAAAVAELERTLKLSDVVLRFVSIRQDHDSPMATPPHREADVISVLPAIMPAEEDEDEETLPVDAEAGDVE